jgi:hypothetical protein
MMKPIGRALMPPRVDTAKGLDEEFSAEASTSTRPK